MSHSTLFHLLGFPILRFGKIKEQHYFVSCGYQSAKGPDVFFLEIDLAADVLEFSDSGQAVNGVPGKAAH